MNTKNSVLITGSSRGLGKELALIFARSGFRVIIHGLEPDELKNTKKEIAKLCDCVAICGDLKKETTLKKLAAAIGVYKVKVLVNNAGILCPYLPLEKLTDAGIQEILDVNLIATIKLTKHAYEYFKKMGNCAIININSRSGLSIQRYRSIYSASKWGLKGFTDVLRIEAQENKVRVLGVYPCRLKKARKETRGLDVSAAAEQIYNFYKKSVKNDLILNESKDTQ